MPKKKFNWFKFILSTLFIIFLIYYLAYSSGYYEAKINKKTILTKEKIEEFENDVKEKKEIDIKNYVNNDYIDYSSTISKIGNKISSGIDSFMDGGVSDFFDFLSRLFT